MSLTKNFGKLKQLTREKFGNAGKTETNDDFRNLEKATEFRKDAASDILTVFTKYVKTIGPKKFPTVMQEKHIPVYVIGQQLIILGNMHDMSEYGTALLHVGTAEEQLSTIQSEYLSKIRANYIEHWESYMAELKEYGHLKKKLESRRLDFDAKLNKVQKSKKEKLELEEDMRMAQTKYEETLKDVTDAMISLNGHEDVHLSRLLEFVNDQLEYHRKSVEVLEQLQSSLGDKGPVNNYGRRRRTTSARSSSTSSRHSNLTSMDVHNPSHWPQQQPQQLEALSTSRRQPPGRSSSSSSLNRNTYMEVTSKAPLTNGRVHLPPMVRRSSSPESVPPAQEIKMVSAVFDFDADGEDELSIRKGDIVTVINEIDEGWWIGEIMDANGTRRQGLFPVNYTEPYSPPPQAHPRPAPPPPISRSSYRPTTTAPHSTQYTRNPSINNPPGTLSRSISSMSIGSTYSTHSNHSDVASVSTNPNFTVPVSGGVSYLVGMGISTTKGNNSMNSITSVESQSYIGSMAPTCRTCGCMEYTENVFKKGSCNNCFHKH